MNWLYKKLIEKYQNEGHNYDTAIDEFRCSQLDLCSRKMFYQKKHPIEPDIYLKGVYTIGHIIHKEIQEIMKQYGFDCETPVKYKDKDIKIIGHADLVSDDKVIDIKTVSRLPTDAYLKHHLQVNTYASILKKPYYGLLYVEKNTLQMRYFEYAQNDELFGYALEKCYEVYNCLCNDILPNPNPNPLCKYCPYRELCLNNKL